LPISQEALAHQPGSSVIEDNSRASFVCIGQGATVNGTSTQPSVMYAVTVKAQLKCAQTGSTAQLRVHHCKQVIPMMEALAPFIGMVSLDAPIKHGTWQPL
jgi:hypothetical protein